MSYRNSVSQGEHDRVVAASAGTYWKMKQDGYVVSTNPGSEKNQYVGGNQNPQYPDVVVWKPSGPGSTSGTAVVIEEVETADSVTEEEAKQWRDYAALGIEQFRLIVPLALAQEALAIVQRLRIAVHEIWGYFSKDGSIQFQKYAG